MKKRESSERKFAVRKPEKLQRNLIFKLINVKSRLSFENRDFSESSIELKNLRWNDFKSLWDMQLM
jgi:hypothetical protein